MLQISTPKTNELAIDGKIKSLIELNEFVTWQAKHFGITQKLTSTITAFDRPLHFRDEQLKGAFKYIIHDHYFKTYNSTVVMKDIFRFQSPLGFVGKLVDEIILTKYLTKLLVDRNKTIKEYAETEKWRSVLS
ncbi:MAG: SRPBCC family protein [Ginsengibacter sp.]